MKLLKSAAQIWVLKPSKADFSAGARYAALSLPWTFNRMMLNKGSAGQQGRAINIAKGIVGQEMLRRKLEEKGVSPTIQSKSYRDKDLFDLRIFLKDKKVKFDFKTIHVFTNYPGVNRERFTPKFVIKHANYGGPDWRMFFPMLVPHTQIGQDKEAYCFAIATSIDPRNDIITNRDDYALTAFPFGNHLEFLSSNKLCLEREKSRKGFKISCSYEAQDLLFMNESISLKIIGEWDGEIREEEVSVKNNKTKKNIGPFSCICSFQMDIDHYQKFNGKISISVSKNDLDKVIFNTSRRNINLLPTNEIDLTAQDFCNLILPSDYTLYVLGWTNKDMFLKNCCKYQSWVWPIDRINRFSNQPWSQITDRDKNMLTKVGFDNCIQKKPSRINAGFMKTHGRGGGACCYVFPNIGRNGGVKETNLYVLPKDLYAMDELGKK
jgi:hypothetical protein